MKGRVCELPRSFVLLSPPYRVYGNLFTQPQTFANSVASDLWLNHIVEVAFGANIKTDTGLPPRLPWTKAELLPTYAGFFIPITITAAVAKDCAHRDAVSTGTHGWVIKDRP